MNKILIILAILFSALFLKNQDNSIIQSEIIDIERGMQKLTRLKVSDFGKTVRYVPLETTDKVLVGRNPVAKVLKNYIVVEDAQKSCLLFDKQNGRFVASIGHTGQDPQAFSDVFSWTDEKEEFLYFKRLPDQLIKYDMSGRFCGKIEFPSGLPSYFLFTDTEIIGYYNEIFQANLPALGIFDKDGVLKDTVPSFIRRIKTKEDGVNSIGRINVFKGGGFSGNQANSGFISIDFKDGISQIYAAYSARLWKNNDNIRFKENFIDTIYTLSAGKLIPTFVFNAGKYHWPLKDINSKEKTNERIFIEYLYENNKSIFFQFIRGVFSDDKVLYNGLYNKQTGEIKISRQRDAIEDDLTHFLPFNPSGMGASGEFVSLVEAWEVMDWLEKHPRAFRNEKLSFLKKFDADMNPIVILVE